MWCLTHHLLISFTLYIGLWLSNLQVHSSFFPDCPYVTEAPGAWSLCFLAFDTNQPTSDCVSPRAGLARDWRVGKKKKKGKVFHLPVCLWSQTDTLSFPWPLVHDNSSFNQVTLTLGHFALTFQSRSSSTFQLSLFSSSLLSPKSYFYWIAVGLPRSQASVSEMQRQLTSVFVNAFMAALHFSILTQPCPSKLNEPLAMTR